MIVIFAVAGQTLLDYLHVDLPALQGAGGLLLILVALELLTGKADDPSQQATSNIALVPLGTPLLAGPGAIVATMLFVQRADGVGRLHGDRARHRRRDGRRLARAALLRRHRQAAAARAASRC